MSCPRAGIVPYTVVKNDIIFLLGIDNRTRDYTDFGGCSVRGETAKQCAFREFSEETCSLFEDDIDISALDTCYSISDYRNTMYFVELNKKWHNNVFINNLFVSKRRMFKDRHHNEIYRLKWIDQSSFKNSIDNRLWVFIRDFIKSNVSHDELIEGIKEIRLISQERKNNITKKYRGKWVSFKSIEGECVGTIKVLKDASGCSVFAFNRVIKPDINHGLNFQMSIDNDVLNLNINEDTGIGEFYIYSDTLVKVLKNHGSIELHSP